MAKAPKLEDYTVLLLCPLVIEQQAAYLMLDKVHDGVVERSAGQTVLYHLGIISCYNVAIAGYPAGEVGIGISGSMVSEALRDFPNLEVGLLVGIAAGIPSPIRDIRLGDVAVAVPNKNNPGVIGYDLVKLGDEEVQLKQWQNATHPLLRSAITSIQVLEGLPGDGFKRHLHVLEKSAAFKRPGPPPASSEWSSKMPQRNAGDGPRVHYGTILSGNGVIKSKKRRDELRNEYDGIAIEMEAAGMMTRLPVAVIRGISDFADSNKNDEWQRYAAITAAAYAKEILIKLGRRKEIGSASPLAIPPNAEELRSKFLDIPNVFPTEFAASAIALIQVYMDCVDCFSCISADQSLGCDCEILDTKLDVEKTIFLQWADRVRLVKQDYDKRLDELGISKGVSRILVNIRELLSEKQGLQKLYGLRPAETDEFTDVKPVMSGLRMTSLIHDLEDMNLRNGQQSKISSIQEIRWVVRDKDQFDGLIRRLSSFIAKLNEIIPDSRGCMVSMAREDLETLRSLGKLRLVFEASVGRQETIAGLAQQIITKDCQRRILNSLWFQTMDDRRKNVKEPYFKTLRWALEPQQTDAKWDNLCEWLKSGSGIYWISGKPGSGKSTLMKYLYGHETTRSLLEAWSRSPNLTMASFFFWDLGTQEQKSLQGLSRALLYHVLESEPFLIAELLPNMWREAHESAERKLPIPFLVEMQAAFEKLVAESSRTRKFCFFIDGLDEYSGNYDEGIALLNSLVGSSNIKVIVSSRPIPECVGAFEKSPKLQLQDLTRDDIASYVHETIGLHSYMIKLSETEPKSATQIMADIVEKASGVFLWVVLACRSLREGFKDYDYVPDLQKRVKDLPAELEALFRHMLSRIPARFQLQAAKLLRICHQSQRIADSEPLQTIGLALIDDGSMSTARVQETSKMSRKEKKTKCDLLEGRLRSRCCGLLEVKRADWRALRNCQSACFCQAGDGAGHGKKAENSHDTLIDSTVEFMHRTVFEFLETSTVWKLDFLQIDDELFDANAALSHLSLHLAHLSLQGAVRQVSTYVKDVLLYGRHGDTSAPSLIINVLFKLVDLLDKSSLNFGTESPFLSSALPHLWTDQDVSHATFLLALEAGLVNFVQSYTTLKGLPLLPKLRFPFFYHAVFRPFLDSLCSWPLGVSDATVRYLLQSECDPNEEFLDEQDNKTTPWKRWLPKMSGSDFQSASLNADITELFIRAGADIAIVEDTVGETLIQRITRQIVSFGLGRDVPLKDQNYIKERGLSLCHLVETRWGQEARLTNGNTISSVTYQPCPSFRTREPERQTNSALDGAKRSRSPYDGMRRMSKKSRKMKYRRQSSVPPSERTPYFSRAPLIVSQQVNRDGPDGLSISNVHRFYRDRNSFDDRER